MFNLFSHEPLKEYPSTMTDYTQLESGIGSSHKAALAHSNYEKLSYERESSDHDPVENEHLLRTEYVGEIPRGSWLTQKWFSSVSLHLLLLAANLILFTSYASGWIPTRSLPDPQHAQS